MYLIPYTTNKSKLSLIYRFLCLRFVQFATHTYYQAILHSIVFRKNKSVLVQLFLFYLQQQVYRWAKRISFPLDENLLHGVLFTSCTQSISSAGLDCNPPTPHNSHTLHFWRGQNLTRLKPTISRYSHFREHLEVRVLGELKGGRRTRQVKLQKRESYPHQHHCLHHHHSNNPHNYHEHPN